MADTATLLNTALTQHQSGQLEQARELYAQILAIEENAEALHWWGILELQAGEHNKALPLLTRASELAPNNAQVLANLGNACFAASKLDAARDAYQGSLALNPASAETQASLGNLLLSVSNTEQAIFHYEKALVLNQKLPEIWRALATALLSRGQQERALSAIERAVHEQSATGQPPTLPLVMTRGNVMVAAGLLDPAKSCFQLVVDQAPSFSQGHLSLAGVHRLQGQFSTAFEHCHKAIELEPEGASGYYALALVQMDQGAIDDARAAFERALSLDPLNGRAHRLLASLNRHTPDHPNIEQMKQALTVDALPDDQRPHLHFGLGKALEDSRQYNDAFAEFQSANRLHRKNTTYSLHDDEKLFAETQRVFSADFVRRHSQPGTSQPAAPQPIFIVGMPRSGTSLLEQILASHPEVHGAGELDWFQRCLKKAVAKSDGEFFGSAETLKRLAASDSKTIQSAGTDYLSRIKTLAPEKRFVVDKMPANFLHLAAIRCALPNATVIHARRNPMATCWSIYKNYFGAQGNAYAFSQDEIGRYYGLYESLMNHWSQLFENELHDIHYEQLVSDQDAASRELLETCGLEWNDACLQFHDTNRPVQTLSAAQVRQPMYSDALEQWQHQSANLKPLEAALGISSTPGTSHTD